MQFAHAFSQSFGFLTETGLEKQPRSTQQSSVDCNSQKDKQNYSRGERGREKRPLKTKHWVRKKRVRFQQEQVPPENLIQVDDRLLQPRGTYNINKCEKKGDHMQLVLKLLCELPDGRRRILKVLVDTGAEANLIKTGIIPPHLIQAAMERLSFVAANGLKIPGGEREVDLNLAFRQRVNDQDSVHKLWRTAKFYEAQIRVDAILSFPWMTQNKIGVFPHHNALAIDQPAFILLYGERERKWNANNKQQECYNSEINRIQAMDGEQFTQYLQNLGF